MAATNSSSRAPKGGKPTRRVAPKPRLAAPPRRISNTPGQEHRASEHAGSGPRRAPSSSKRRSPNGARPEGSEKRSPPSRAGGSSDRPRRAGAPRSERRDGLVGRARDERRASRRTDPAARRGGGAPSSRKPRSGRPAARTPAPLTPEQRKRVEAGEHARAKGWGSVARKGAINITSTGHELGDPKSRDATARTSAADGSQRTSSVHDRSQRVSDPRAYALPGDVAAEVRRAFIGTAYMREKMVDTLTRAAEAYDRQALRGGAASRSYRRQRHAGRCSGARAHGVGCVPRGAMGHGKDPSTSVLRNHWGPRAPAARNGRRSCEPPLSGGGEDLR